MECEYCKKILKNSITLKNHQKTKGCLKTRGIDNSVLVSFKCENCHKDFTTKRSVWFDNRMDEIDPRKYQIIINKAESMRTLSEDNAEFKKELISITAVWKIKFFF